MVAIERQEKRTNRLIIITTRMAAAVAFSPSAKLIHTSKTISFSRGFANAPKLSSNLQLTYAVWSQPKHAIYFTYEARMYFLL